MQASTQSLYSQSTWDSGKNQSQKTNRGTRVFRGALVGPVRSGALGKNTKSCNPSPFSVFDSVDEILENHKKYSVLARQPLILPAGGPERLQGEKKKAFRRRQNLRKKYLRCLMPDHRVSSCGRIPIPTKNGISIRRIENRFYYQGVSRCDCVWLCPDCSLKISTGRRDELISAMKEAKVQGLQYYMLTLTVPHYAHDSLRTVLDQISDAFRKLKNRKTWKQLAHYNQIVGDVRALEVTNGKNGWHPHFHVIVLQKNEIEKNHLYSSILQYWQNACVSVGLPRPNEHGVDIRDHQGVEEYISKWGLAGEIAKGFEKTGSIGHLSPFQLLDRYGEGDEIAGQKFLEYAKEFKGKRQLVWSKGLKSMLKVPEKTDAEMIDDVEKAESVESAEFATLSAHEFSVLVKENKDIECLEVCEKGYDYWRRWMDRIMQPHEKKWEKIKGKKSEEFEKAREKFLENLKH